MRYLLLLLLFTGLTSYAQIELVKDINPSGNGYGGGPIVIYNNQLFFAGQGNTGNIELWKSDGTPEGTAVVKEILSTGSANPGGLTVTENYLYFNASFAGGRRLFRTDGTAEGTVQAGDGSVTYNFVNGLTAIGNKVYFVWNDPNENFGTELYVLEDGQTIATRLTDFQEGSANSTFSELTAFNGQLLFASSNSADGLGNELYISDGTPSGTTLLKDINTGDLSSNPAELTVVGSKVYFSAFTLAEGREIWASDGTTEGTVLVGDIFPGTDDSNPTRFTGNSESQVFFRVRGVGTGEELWVTNGTQSELVKDVRAGIESSLADNLTSTPNGIFFSAFTDATGYELFFSDGTEGGTSLVKDIRVGESGGLQYSGLSEWLWSEGNLYFPATDGTNGIELWKSNGTADGTEMIADLNPGELGSSPQSLLFWQGSIYFFGIGPTGNELYKIVLFDPCEGVQCPFGQVCKNGFCIDPCENVNCPEGQTCENGECVVPDPCEGVDCPFGQVCFQGSCYDAKTSGLVIDQFGNPIQDVLVQNLNTNESVLSDAFGNYFIANNGTVTFTKEGFVSKKILTNNATTTVTLYRGCEGTFCPFGEVCYAGQCTDPNESISLTFNIRSELDDMPLQGIELYPLDNLDNKVISDANGDVSISVDVSTLIRIEDPSNNYRSLTINPESVTSNVLMQGLCTGVNCPFGEICYEGSCYNPNQTIVSGYVFDKDSLAIPDVLVEVSGGAQTRTTSNGVFSLNLDFNPDSVELNFSKTGVGLQKQFVYPGLNNEIYLYDNDKCFDVMCSFGQICYEGSCYDPGTEVNQDACNGILCPFGQVCFEGSCYDPCDEPDLCPNTLEEDKCANVQCPFGQVCFEGSCYDPCVEGGENCYNNDPDPCANISAPPGYVCLNGVVVPDCPSNTLACANATTDICSIVSCPPGDICFSCTDPTGANTSGTSSISGTLNLENLNSGGRVASTQNENIFIYLVETATGRKTAIDVTDADGNFAYENVPAGTYEIFMTARGYFFSQDQQQLVVEQDDDIILSISSKDRLVTVERSRVTGLVPPNFQYPTSWFPIPNTGSIFFIEETGIQNLSIYTLQGRKVNREKSFEIKNGRTELQLDQPLPQGFYILQWNSTATENFQTQTVIISR